MPKCSHTQDERFALVIKGALFEGYQLCHNARETGNVEPLGEGEFSQALISLGKNPKSFVEDIRDRYDPIRAKKKESSGRGSGRSSNNPELADAPYDPCLCSKRVWNQGLGAQCQSVKVDGCDFCTRCTKEFGNKGALPFGYYDQEKPQQDLVTGKNLPWKTLADFDSTKNKKPAMKVGEIREKLEELGLDTTGKKAELLERLEAAISAEEEVAQPVASPKKKVKKIMKKKSKTPKKAAKKENRLVQKIVGANGQSIELDLGPDNGAGVYPQQEAPQPEVAVEEEVNAHPPVRAMFVEPKEKVEEEEVADAGEGLDHEVEVEEEVKDEEEVEDEEEVGNPVEPDGEETEDEFDADDFDEIEFEDIDYLYDESSNKVYTMDGNHVGSWDDDDGIIWLKTPEVDAIKEMNGHQ